MKELKNIFKQLQFNEENHTYEVEGENYIAASNVIKNFYEEFDTEGIAKRSAKKTGKSPEYFKKKWEKKRVTAADNGTRVHDFAERYAEDNTLIPSCSQERSAVKWFKELPEYYKVVALELRMFSRIFKYAGTADMILLDRRDNTLVIADWKTNHVDLFKNFQFKKMYPPFEFLLDSPYNHYQIQFSLYQIILEERGFTVSDRMLIWLKDDEYVTFNTYDYTKLLKDWFYKNMQ